MVGYGIEGKVTYIVTDNGSNFVKAFKEYAPSDAESEPEEETDDELAAELQVEEEEEEDISTVSAGDILDCFDAREEDDDNSIPLILPRHLR